jgi:hypothetical protein
LAVPRVSFLGARYLLTGAGYRVLKSWKSSPGPLNNRRVLTEVNPGPEWEIAVGVPQLLSRSSRLGDCPPEVIARHLATLADRPWVRALEPERMTGKQAQRGLAARLQSRLRFTARPAQAPRIQGRRVLLVDDFITSGRTVRGAARALLWMGAAQVLVYALGIRPRLQDPSRPASAPLRPAPPREAAPGPGTRRLA